MLMQVSLIYHSVRDIGQPTKGWIPAPVPASPLPEMVSNSLTWNRLIAVASSSIKATKAQTRPISQVTAGDLPHAKSLEHPGGKRANLHADTSTTIIWNCSRTWLLNSREGQTGYLQCISYPPNLALCTGSHLKRTHSSMSSHARAGSTNQG